MRIVVFARSTPAHVTGGMERVSWDLATAWAEAGHDVRVCTTPLPALPVERLAPVPGLTVGSLPGTPGRFSERWFRATRRVDLTDADVVLGVSAAARAVAGRPGAPPVVLQAHGTSLMEITTRVASRSWASALRLPRNVAWLGRDLAEYHRYSAVVAVGPAVAASLARLPRAVLPARRETIENGVRPSAGPPRAPVAGTALFVGRLHEEKGLASVLDALRASTVRLEVVGEGPAREAWGARVRALGVDDRVAFAGRLGPDEVRAALRRAAVLVVPSTRREGLPTVILEALAEARPVLVSREVAAVLGDPLPEGVSAVERDEWADALERHAWAAPARAVQLPERFTLAHAATRYLDLFADLVRGSA